MSYSEIIELIISYLKANPEGCALLGILLIAVIHQLYFYFQYICKGAKMTAPAKKVNRTYPLPGVSVIVCARNEESNLQDYLHSLLNQNYPTFEVIVVDDGSEDNTYNILERYIQQTPKLYHTFVPRGARLISRKKLALTIGIKAANYDYILLTDADCRPESRQWIQEMMSGFQDKQTEIVIGFGPYFEKKSLLNRFICYDTLFSGLQYMGMAKAGYPYMGVGRNLAYRKETFFANNGFHGLLNERAGDDDLFVNKVANNINTKVICNSNALTWSPPKRTWHEWLHQKRRHISVSPHYNTNSKIRIITEPITRGMVYFLLLFSMIHSAINGQWIIGFVALGLCGIRLLTQLTIINVATKRLKMRGVGLGIILYDIILPLISLFILITQPFYRKKQQFYW